MLEIHVYILTITVNNNEPLIRVYTNPAAARQSAKAYVEYRDDLSWLTCNDCNWEGRTCKKREKVIEIGIEERKIEDKYNNDWA